MARQNFGFGGGANMQQLMRQAQKMQQAMTDAQEKLDAQEYEAQSGGGVVSVKVNGKRELLSLTIDPKVVDPDDVEMLQDLVMAAVARVLHRKAEFVRLRVDFAAYLHKMQTRGHMGHEAVRGFLHVIRNQIEPPFNVQKIPPVDFIFE